MRDAGAVEHQPLRFGDRTLIADCKRDEHAGIRPAVERRHDSRPNRFARTLDIVVRPPDERIDA